VTELEFLDALDELLGPIGDDEPACQVAGCRTEATTTAHMDCPGDGHPWQLLCAAHRDAAVARYHDGAYCLRHDLDLPAPVLEWRSL